jgi:hypothetical protein
MSRPKVAARNWKLKIENWKLAVRRNLEVLVVLVVLEDLLSQYSLLNSQFLIFNFSFHVSGTTSPR